jgi:hypothetical protein
MFFDCIKKYRKHHSIINSFFLKMDILFYVQFLFYKKVFQGPFFKKSFFSFSKHNAVKSKLFFLV